LETQKIIHQLRQKIHNRLCKKVRFEPWFLGVLILVAIFVFILVEWIIGSLATSIQIARYEVQPIDESSIYESIKHNIKEDFKLLLRAQPSSLNGADITQNVAKGQVMAVIVENYTPIRHTQVGLEDAAIVYEVPAEGGITRLLAIYDGNPVATIGPVRSARPYLITWASEYRAGFAHVGGSQAALNNLKTNFRVFDIDEFADYKTIWRNNDYLAPHNAFTSTSNILKRLKKEKYNYPVKSKRFPFKDADKTPGDISTVSIDFSITPYKVKYVYDSVAQTYTRYNGGKVHHNIKPSNIIVQYVDTEVLDEIGRLRIQTHGTGNALVFRDGKVIEGTWEKDASINSKDQDMSQSWTKFFDKDGEEIEMYRGQIWIDIVPNGRPVNYF
jgi:hypothetical protein